MNGEGVFKVRAAQPYHKNFEVAITTPSESLSRIYPIRVFYLPGVSNVFHIGAIYFYNKHRICECKRQRVLKGFGIMSFFFGFGVMIARSCFKSVQFGDSWIILVPFFHNKFRETSQELGHYLR